MAINILQELNLGAAKASFSRDEVETLADIKKLNIAQKYPNNYDIFCKEDGCKYRLNKTSHSTMQDNLPHPTGKWRRVDSVISSSMPAPITVGDVVLYLGPTVMDQVDHSKVKFQTGKYYRTEYTKVNKQMYAFVQNTAPDVPDTSPNPAVIWFSETSTLSEGSVLFTPVNGSIFDNKEHGIIMTSNWDGESAISGSSYEYLDNSNSAKLGMVRNSDFDTTFDSYPELTWNLFDTEAELENIKQNVIPEAISPVVDDISALETKVAKSNKLADRFTDAEMDKLFKKVSEKIISSVNGVNDVDFRICACASSDNWATATITKYMETPLSGDLTDYHIALPGPYGNTFDTIAVSCGISFTNGTSATGMPAYEAMSKKSIDTWLNVYLLNPVAIYTAQTISSSSFDKSTYYRTRVKDGGPYNATIKYSDMEPLKSNAYESPSRIHFLVFIQVNSNTTAEDLNAVDLFELAKKAIVPVGSTSGMLTEFDSVKENASSAVTDIESLSATVDTRIPSKTSDFIKENIFEDKTPVHMIASYSESYHGPGTYDNTNNNGLISIGSTYDHTDANRSITPVFKNYFDPDSASADYVDASEVLAIKESEVWSNKASYIAIPVYIGSATTKALLAESLTGIISSFNPSYNYKMTLNGRSVNTYGTLVDIYAGIGSSDKIDSIGNVKSWTRLTKNSFSASELVASLPDIIYGTYRRLTLVLVYNVYYGDYPVFDSADIIRIDSDTLIANTLNIAKNSLDKRLSDIEEATGDVSDLIETVNGISASVTEATTKAARLDPLTDEMILEIAGAEEEVKEFIYGGNADGFVAVYNREAEFMYEMDLEKQKSCIDIASFFYQSDSFRSLEYTTDAGSTYTMYVFQSPAFYHVPYPTDAIDLYLTSAAEENKISYENKIADASQSEEALEVLNDSFVTSAVNDNKCLLVSNTILLNKENEEESRTVSAEELDSVLANDVEVTLGTYDCDTFTYDIDEAYVGIAIYTDVLKIIHDFLPEREQDPEFETSSGAYKLMYDLNDGSMTYLRIGVRNVENLDANHIRFTLGDEEYFGGLKDYILSRGLEQVQDLFRSADIPYTEETALKYLGIRLSVVTYIHIHRDNEAILDVNKLYNSNLSNSLAEHIQVLSGGKNFIDSTNESIRSLNNRIKNSKSVIDKHISEIKYDMSDMDTKIKNTDSKIEEANSGIENINSRIPQKTTEYIKNNIIDYKNLTLAVAQNYNSDNFTHFVSLGVGTYDHSDTNRTIAPVFINYFDDTKDDYTASFTVPVFNPNKTRDTYVGILGYLASAQTKQALADKLRGIVVKYDRDVSYYDNINKYFFIKDVYVKVSGAEIADFIDSTGWVRVDSGSDLGEVFENISDIVYGNRYAQVIIVTDGYYGDSSFEDIENFETNFNNIMQLICFENDILGSKLEEGGSSGDVSALEERTSAIETKLEPLTDDIIHSITDKELSEANIVGGDLFDWTEVFDHNTPPTSRDITQYVKLRDVGELLDYNDTCIFNSSIEFEEADETLDDGSSYHTGIMTTSDYYLYPYSTEYLDALLTGQSFYENGIIDCSDPDGSDTVSYLLRNSSLGNRCLDISTSIIFPNGQRWFPFNNKDEMLGYSINIELGSYTTNNNNFDIDEVWIGFSLYPSYEYISSMGSELSEAQWALMEIANNAYNVDGALGTKFIRLAVRDLIDDSKNSISLKLKDIPGLSEEIQNMFSDVVATAKEQGLDEEDLKDILDVRMSLMIPINTHIEEELTSFDILGLRDVSSEIIEHISINKESGNFIENTISELDTLSNKDKEFEKAFADLEPKLDGLTGDPSTEIIVGAATPSAAPSLDNRAISLGYDLKVQKLDGFPYIYMSGSKIAPYSEEDISELVNTSSIDSEFEGTLTFLGQITANNGTSVNYNVVDYSNILRSKITIDASKMPEGFVLKKVIFGLIPCVAMDAARYFTMLVEPKQDLSKGITTIEIKKTMLNSFINAMMEEMPSVIAQYALGVACFVDVGDKVEDASFLNDIDFSLFDQAITFITPGENRLNALPSLIEETKRTSKISDAGFELLNVIDESYNIANLSRLLAYKENYASLIRQTPIVPVTANRIIENDEMVSLEKDFNGLVYLGDNYFSDTDSLKPEFKNYMDSSYTSYTPLKNMLLELSGIPNRRYIGLFGYFNVVDDGLSSRDNFRTAASFAELMRTLKENGTYIDTSDYVMDDSSNEEKLRNGIAIPLGSDFSSVSSYCVSYNRTYVTVLNCDSYSKYEPFYYYNNKKIGQDINKFKWILCKPTDSLYDLLSKNFSEDDFDTSYGSRCCLGVITVLDINSLDGSFSEDENSKMYQDLAAMDFSSQMPKLCYAAFNKIADFAVAASNTKNIKESVGNIDYKEFNATPIAFATQSVDSESGSDPVNYDAIIYPRLVLPPKLDSTTNTYTVRFHGTTEEENNLTVNDLVTNGDVFMFFSFFGDNLLHVNFGGDYSHGKSTELSELNKLNRTGGIVWYNTRYMKDSSIDFTQHGDYDASELFVNIDSSQIRELYAAVIPNDSPSNSIQQYFTSKYNSSTGKLLETMSDIPGFVKVPLDYHEEDLTGTKRTVSLETIIDLCGRPVYSGNINPKGGYILFVAKLNETKAGVTKYLNDYTYYHYPISSFCPFNNYEDNFGYYSAYDFGWCDIFPNSQHMMDNPPCYITRSLDNSIKQAKNVALKAAQEAVADRAKATQFYTDYSDLRENLPNGGSGYVLKVDPNNSSKYVADVYIRDIDGSSLIKIVSDAPCETSHEII